MTGPLARRIPEDNAVRWFSLKDMAESLGSRHVMTLYFDDVAQFGKRFTGWSTGIVRFSWEPSTEHLSDLVKPPIEWFGEVGGVTGARDRDRVEAVMSAVQDIVQQMRGLEGPIASWKVLEQSIYEATAVGLPRELSADSSRTVSWAVAIADAFLQAGASREAVEKWYASLEDEIQRLRNIRVLPRYELYPHQVPAIQSWVEAGHLGILSLPTATGKTVLGIEAIRERVEAGCERFLVLVPSRLLQAQWLREIREKLYLPRLSVWAGSPSTHGSGIWIMTLQQAAKVGGPLGLTRHFDLTIVDEVHHTLTGKADGFASVVSRVRTDAALGLSATLPDAMAEEVLGPVVHSLDFRKAILEGHIPRFSMTFTPCPVAEDDRRDYAALTRQMAEREPRIRAKAEQDGAFLETLDGEPWSVEDYLQWLKPSPSTADEVIGQYLHLDSKREGVLRDSRPKIDVAAQEIRDRLGDRVGFVMADRVDFADAIHGLLRDVPGFLAHGQMGRRERDAAIERIRNARRRALLVSARLADEGLDVPQASIAFNVSSPSTMTNLVQRLGRILRPAEGKPKPVFHHFESISEWSHGEEPSNSALEGALARFAIRAQDALSLGTVLDLRWPHGVQVSRDALQKARQALQSGDVESQDAAVQTVASRTRRAGKVYASLEEADRATIDDLCQGPWQRALEEMANLERDDAAGVFLREHGLFHLLFQP